MYVNNYVIFLTDLVSRVQMGCGDAGFSSVRRNFEYLGAGSTWSFLHSLVGVPRLG